MPYDEMGFDLPANAWNKEMRGYSETITPLSDWSNNPFNGELLLNPCGGISTCSPIPLRRSAG